MDAVKIPFVDLSAGYLEQQSALDSAWRSTTASGWFVLGESVERFEEGFAAYCEAKHCVGVGNGLDALSLILRAMGLKPGDEVLVPGNTFVATWLAVTHAGGVPVPVEPRLDTANLDPEGVERAITARTRAIVAVHLYGQPAEMEPMLEIARRKGLRLIEDAAQAHGARYSGRRVGGLADAAAFSFYPAKNLGAFGDGGAVVTNDGQLAARVRQLRNYGSSRKYFHEVAGFNSRLDALQAAVLSIKLTRLDAWNAVRRAVAATYLARLAGAPELTLPVVPAWAEPVWHLFVVRHPERDRLQRHLAEQGIATLIHYPEPPHRAGAYAGSAAARCSLPVTDQLASTVLSLPMWPQITEEQIERVCEAIRSFRRGAE